MSWLFSKRMQMNTCPVCNQEFTPKRKEQLFCSVDFRQKNNAKGRNVRGKKIGIAKE